MKKILHLFRKEKFTEGFINLMMCIQEYEHIFWVYGERDYLNDQCTYLKYDNVKYFPRLEIKINKRNTEKELQNFDLIVYHGVFEEFLIEYFYTHKKLLNKLILYFWGGDKEFPENRYERKENRHERRAKRYIVNNALAVVTIIPQDMIDLRKKYYLKGKQFCAKYYDAYEAELINKLANTPKLHRKTINIQVGNSATQTNNHLDVLKILSKFKENKINIYVPLSYGTTEYAKKVIAYGKEIFGDKFIPITEFMSLEKYHSFLYEMDIAIFDMKRQQALGNIYAQMMMGCKIYLTKSSLLWDFFVKNLGCIVSDINDIRETEIEKFREFPEEYRKHNIEKIREIFSKERAIEEWKNLFDLV